jgi:phosphate-selective porin OprO/OprP
LAAAPASIGLSQEPGANANLYDAAAIAPVAGYLQDGLESAQQTTDERLAQLEAEVAALRAQSGQALPAEWCVPETPTPSAPTYPGVRLTGFFQLDAGWFNQDAASEATFGDIQDARGFRRARLAAVGEVAENTGYSLEMDFAAPGRPSFMDVWMEQRGLPLVGNMRIGHFRQYLGMSELTSVRELTFLERPLPFAFSPFRQLGIGFHDTYWDQAGTWGVSGFAFPSDNFGDVQGDRGYGGSGRLTAVAWQSAVGDALLHVGGGYALTVPVDHDLRYRNTPEFGGPFGGQLGNVGDVPFFVDTLPMDVDEAHIFNGELAGSFGSLHVMSEARFARAELDNGGTITFPSAYVETGYILTGERRPYNYDTGVLGRVVPASPVGRCGGWGAWELAGRYSYIDLNEGGVGGGRLNDVTAGLNWYLNRFTKFQLNYIRAMLDRPPQGDSDTNIVAVRAQLDF